MQLSRHTDELKSAIQLALRQPDACAAVRDAYARLQLEIDRRKPVCVASGKCCHFESYGHRLYVTTLELAAFKLDIQSTSPVVVAKGLPVITEGCPLQVGKLCGVHAIRPFGCRIFFCDPAATAWQQEQYELFHQELKQLHERFGVSYFYVEWRAGLAALDL